jgi:hypothetical protein
VKGVSLKKSVVHLNETYGYSVCFAEAYGVLCDAKNSRTKRMTFDLFCTTTKIKNRACLCILKSFFRPCHCVSTDSNYIILAQKLNFQLKMRLTLLAVFWTAASAFGIQSPKERRAAFGMLSATISPVVSTENLALLSPRGRDAVERLIAYDVDGHQAHVYKNWPAAGEDDQGKQQLAEQVRNSWIFHKYSKQDAHRDSNHSYSLY